MHIRFVGKHTFHVAINHRKEAQKPMMVSCLKRMTNSQI